MKTRIGPAIEDHLGNVGNRVTLEFDAADGLAGHHHFGTHGMSDAEIIAERDRIIEHHSRKAARFNGFEGTVRGQEIAGSGFVVDCCTIIERGSDVELVAIARNSTGEAIRIRTVHGSISAIPDNLEILRMLHDALTVQDTRVRAAKSREGSLATLLGAIDDEDGHPTSGVRS